MMAKLRNRTLVDVESAPDFISGSFSANDKNTQQNDRCKEHGHERKIPVLFKIGDVENSRDDAAKLHGEQPHDVAVPAASVDQNADYKHHIHDQDTGRKHKIDGPALVSQYEVDGDGC